MTISTFKDKEVFETWYAGKIGDGSNILVSQIYDIVAKGVSKAAAANLISPHRKHGRRRAFRTAPDI